MVATQFEGGRRPLALQESRTRRTDPLDKYPLTTTKARIRDLLGMPHGTASQRLLRVVVFALLKETSRTICYRCGNPMTADTWSIDHIENWLDGPADLYWDIANISYSHLRCNVAASRGSANKKRLTKDGRAWCSKHQGYAPIACFYRSKQTSTGLDYWCIDCKKESQQRSRGREE